MILCFKKLRLWIFARSPVLRRAGPLVLIAFIAGCAVADRGTPLPRELSAAARISGFENIRFSIDKIELRREYYKAIEAAKGSNPEIALLAISGGGADGAFGAGILCGWSDRGDRPEFQIVTGVSTGALTAPFAFLGSGFDAALRTAYTTLHDEDVFRSRSLLGMLRGDSMSKTGPLYHTISNYIDESTLLAIAAEHKKGRRLFVMTTNLDAQAPVVWNMGAVAASGHAEALDLFRRIIIASASIPVAFPPQYIEVEADGRTFTEMHVDGGVMGQVFLHLPPLSEDRQLADNQTLVAYVIRNSKIVGKYKRMTPLILPILTRTLESLVVTQGVGNLYEIYEQTREARAEYRLAYVPDHFETDHHDMFEPEAMKAMFDLSYSLALDGYPWMERPPESL